MADNSALAEDESSGPSVCLEVPIDILFLIFTYLPPSTLSACCRLSKRTHLTAFDALYRHIRPTSRNILDLIFRLSQPFPTASSADGAPELLATKVHSFVLSEAKSSFDMYLGNIQDLLPKLTRLKVLVLDLTPTSAWILPRVGWNSDEGNVAKEPAFRLKIFHCSLQYDSTLGDFLETQPDILTLIVRAPVVTNPLPVLPHTFLPNLTFLQAPWRLAAALVSGRPISDLITWHLTMNSARDQSPNTNAEVVAYLEEDPDISCLSRSTFDGGLKRHFINWSFLSVQGPERLGQATPGLVRLSIDADGVDPSDESPGRNCGVPNRPLTIHKIA
ncbi:hypothetical protein CPB83DRAFT_342132 [Crepidotus variabilis]|uniref:F-box domain-containing protein n=1 Tax=Crepidotus variabilis TaxID=179855 RepID=A0A9P6JWG5_9AGAR|nr:hypothetical protein CPB83DRAFT_342132 [Crepidotus variabilis]